MPEALEITLDPLSRDESLEVLRAVVTTDGVPDAAVHAVLARSEGNPFFLEELARALAENPALGTAGPVPATIQEVLLSRLARLEPEDLHVLQTAAVVGRDVPRVLLRALASLDEDALRASLTRLCASQFLREGMASEEAGHTFKHALTHEVAYGTLSPEERRALHAAAVEAIEGAYAGRLAERRDQLAHHVARGEVWGKALIYFRTSINFSEEDVYVAWRAGDHAHAIARAQDDMRISTEFANLIGQMEVQLRLGRAYHSVGAYAQVIETLRRNTDVVTGDTPTLRRTRTLATLSRVWLALAHAERGDAAEALRAASEALEGSEALEDAYARAAAPWSRGVVVLLDGAVDEACVWLSRADEAARHSEAVDLAPGIGAALGFAQALAGSLDDALVTLRAAVEDAEARSLVANHALRLAWWAEAERLAGHLDQAHALAKRAVELARKHGERGHEAWALRVLADVTAARRDAGAEALHREALALAHELGMRPLVARGERGFV